MEIDPTNLSMRENYKIMTGLVVPRPIAWITTLSEGGKVNLAPFSAFTFVSHKPPMIAVSIGRRDKVLKDTGHNIIRDGEFVVNIARQDMLQALHDSSAVYEAEDSEVEALGLDTTPSAVVRPPRLRIAPACMECRLHLAIPLGDERNYLMVGEVKRFHVDDGLIRNGKIETRELNPIARLGGPKYTTLGEILTLSPAEVKCRDRGTVDAMQNAT